MKFFAVGPKTIQERAAYKTPSWMESVLVAAPVGAVKAMIAAPIWIWVSEQPLENLPPALVGMGLGFALYDTIKHKNTKIKTVSGDGLVQQAPQHETPKTLDENGFAPRKPNIKL